MNESQKWMEIIKRFSNTDETERCPNCGYEENLEVIISEEGQLHFIVRDATDIHILTGEGFDIWFR